jgi:hypothetical protein
MFRVALLAVAATLLPVHTALAQTDTTQPSGLVSINLTKSSLASALEPGAAPQASRSLPSRGYFIRVFGGLWFGSGEGFLAGGGAMFQPFTNKQHEVGGNVSFLRVESSNGLMFEANYNYSFNDVQWGAFKPYALAGLNIARFGGSDECDEFNDEFGDFFEVDCSSTDTALQIGGGIRRPLNDREFFIEFLFAFFYGNPGILRAGISW